MTVVISSLIPRAALVTGGARRLGRAIAVELARQGFDVAIHCGTSVSAAGHEEQPWEVNSSTTVGRAEALPAKTTARDAKTSFFNQFMPDSLKIYRFTKNIIIAQPALFSYAKVRKNLRFSR